MTILDAVLVALPFAVLMLWPKRRLTVTFEPLSTTRRKKRD